MAAKTKRSAAESIRRRLTAAVADLGYIRSKTTFWVRPREYVAEFFHLHLFTFAPSFRVHLGIRVMNDDFPALAPNRLHSFDKWYRTGRRSLPLIEGWCATATGLSTVRKELVFDFDGSPEIMARCARDLERLVREVGEPWFAAHRDLNRLASEPGRVLTACP